MKKSIFILGALLISLSTSAFAQKHKPHNHNHGPHVSNHHHQKHKPHHQKHKPHISNRHNGFFGGILAGFLFSEIFESATHNYRQMYFEYKPSKDTWRLKKDFTKNGSIFYDNEKVTAKFENPNGGRDFVVRLNSRGQWDLDCPRRLAKLFKNKVRRNL